MLELILMQQIRITRLKAGFRGESLSASPDPTLMKEKIIGD